MFIEWLLSIVVCTGAGVCDEYVVDTFVQPDQCVIALQYVDLSGVESLSCEKTVILQSTNS